MNTFLVRLGFGFALACIAVTLAGCAGQSIKTQSTPSYAAFEITFQPDPPVQPTDIVIDPNDGNAILQVVKTPGPDDNKIVWQSKQKFSIKFVQICDQSQPLPAGKELGDEKKNWNEAKEKDGVWQYKLNLKQGSGHGKETVGAKYLVKHVASGVTIDPVIIVGR
jgi:hypothetical protein